MSLQLVNTAPGDDSTPLKPGQSVFLGLRSTTLSVELGSLSSHLALSSIQQGAVSPEADTHLTAVGCSTIFETPERVRPITDQASRTFPGTGMLITKNSNDDGEQSIFEVKVPIKTGASVMAHFKVRIKNAWTLFKPEWCFLTNMTGVYLGLEHGSFNTAAYLFLRKNAGVGSLVYGGPQATATSTRPAQTEVSYDWTTVGDGGLIEFFILFNTYSSPYQVEIWAKKPTDAAPVVVATIPYLTLGQFPATDTHAENSRPGVDDHATIIFGIPGQTGDQLQIDDWTLYPDYRVAVVTGESTANSKLDISPDGPVIYRADSNLLPEAADPARWFTMVTAPSPAGVTPDAPTLYYQPGKRTQATSVRIPKTNNGGVISFKRDEPRLGQLQDGAMIEAFISGSGQRFQECFGGGFGLDDGAQQYKVMMVENADGMTYAIQKDPLQEGDSHQGYYLPTNQDSSLFQVDFTSPKLVRLAVDRRRGVVELYAVEERFPILSVPLSGEFPITANLNQVFFGHLSILPTTGTIDVEFLNYLSAYLAWDGLDNKLPDDGTLNAGARFTAQINDGSGLDVGSCTIANGILNIFKKKIADSNSKRYYSLAQNFDIRKGIQVDFRTNVLTYNSVTGEQFASNTAVGGGLILYLGTKRLELDFYDCGVNGRRLGILPGSGTADDIINQTPLGQKYSCPVDWTQDTFYRLVVRPYDSIKVYTGSVAGTPALVIPWPDDTDGFDLPDDTTTPALVFGHFNGLTSSTMNWYYMRWGLSHGYDVSVTEAFPDGYPSYLFGGKEFVLSDFDEA